MLTTLKKFGLLLAALLAFDASAAGVVLPSFVPEGTGAKARSYQDKNRDVVSAFDFLTPAQLADVKAGNLTQNVSGAIQAWLTRCATTGKACYAPRGSYYMGATGVTVAAGIKVLGDGASAFYWSDALAGAAITVTQPHVVFEDISLEKPTRASAPGAGVVAIDVQAHDFTARGVRIESTGGLAAQGWYAGYKFIEWTHHIFGGNVAGYKYGVWIERANAVLIHGGSYAAQEMTGGASVYINGGAGHAVMGANLEGGALAGVYVSDGGDASSGNATVAIHGNYFEGQRVHVYILGSAAPGKDARGVSVIGNFFNGLTTNLKGLYADRVSGLDVSANLFINHTTYGVELGALASDVRIAASNVYISSVGGWAALSIAAGVTGLLEDGTTNTTRALGWNYALDALQGSGIINQRADSYSVLSGGDGTLRGANILLFGQSGGVPREGRLGSSPDGASVTYPLKWATNAAGNASLLGFYDTAPILKPAGVAVTAAAIHAALVALGLIAP